MQVYLYDLQNKVRKERLISIQNLDTFTPKGEQKANMTDISKCDSKLKNGKTCPLRDRCFRYTAPADKYLQAYLEAPYSEEKGECPYIMQVRERSNLKVPNCS